MRSATSDREAELARRGWLMKSAINAAALVGLATNPRRRHSALDYRVGSWFVEQLLPQRAVVPIVGAAVGRTADEHVVELGHVPDGDEAHDNEAQGSSRVVKCAP